MAIKKRIVTILYHGFNHDVQDVLLPGLEEIQWINYPELGFEETFHRLITAIDTDLEWVRQHTRFGLRAARWEASGQNNGFLLHGAELREAIRWLEQAATIKDRQLSELHQQYVRASEEWEAGEIKRLTDLNEEKERQRLQAEKARHDAEEEKRRTEKVSRLAVARELVAFSTLSLENDPERSILLALHALDATRSAYRIVIPEAEGALHRAILRSPIRCCLRGHLDLIFNVAVSADGRLAVSASRDCTLKSGT